MKTQVGAVIAMMCSVGAMMCFVGAAMAEDDAPGNNDEALAAAVVRQWETAWNNGDGKAVADLYAADGVHMVAQNTFMGHAAIEQLANVATQAGAGDLVISIEHVRSFRKTVWFNGTYSMHVNGELTRGYWSGLDVRDGNGLKIARSVSVALAPDAQKAPRDGDACRTGRQA